MLKRFFGKNEPHVTLAPADPSPPPTMNPAHDIAAIFGVAVSGSSVYVTTTSSLVALDLATGHPRFEVHLGLPPVGLPTSDGSSVFYLSRAGSYCQIVAVDAATGAERWRSDSAEMLTPDRATIASPYGGMVFVPSQIGPMGFSAETGKAESLLASDPSVIAWGIAGCEHAIERGIYPYRVGQEGVGVISIDEKQPKWSVRHELCPSAPPIVTRSGRMFTFGSDGRFACADVETGRGILRVDNDNVCPRSGDIAVEATQRLLFVAVAGVLDVYDAIAREFAWEKDTAYPDRTVLGMSTDEETLLMNGPKNFIFALDAATGAIRWAGQCPNTAGAKGFIPAGDDTFLVYTTSSASDGRTVPPSVSLREIDRGMPIWSFELEART